MAQYWIVLACAALLACQNTGSVTVETDFDREVDFGDYRTYAQLPPPSRSGRYPRYTEIAGRRIQAWIDEALLEKGYRRAPLDRADVHVAFSVDGTPRTEIWYWGTDNFFGVRGVSTAHLLEGSLYIDIVDRSRERLVWRGIGRKQTLNDSFEPVETQRAVARILGRYPPDAIRGRSATTTSSGS